MPVHNNAYKAVAGKCELETMNKKLIKLETVKETPETANSSFVKRWR